MSSGRSNYRKRVEREEWGGSRGVEVGGNVSIAFCVNIFLLVVLDADVSITSSCLLLQQKFIFHFSFIDASDCPPLLAYIFLLVRSFTSSFDYSWRSISCHPSPLTIKSPASKCVRKKRKPCANILKFTHEMKTIFK